MEDKDAIKIMVQKLNRRERANDFISWILFTMMFIGLTLFAVGVFQLHLPQSTATTTGWAIEISRLNISYNTTQSLLTIKNLDTTKLNSFITFIQLSILGFMLILLSFLFNWILSTDQEIIEREKKTLAMVDLYLTEKISFMELVEKYDLPISKAEKVFKNVISEIEKIKKEDSINLR